MPSPRSNGSKGREFLRSGGWGVGDSRNANRRERLPRILIVCEGARTEPNYFKGFRIPSVEVEVHGLGLDPLGLVTEAVARRNAAREEAKRSGDPDTSYAQVWCVFDRDEVPAGRFNAALKLARDDGGIEIAASNQAFELWYLLHFHFHDEAQHRSRYQEILSLRMNRPYKKNDPSIYEDLLGKQAAAIRHAKTLLARYDPEHNPERDDPSTTVFRLVEALMKFQH